ncbi:hypothetical protein E2562_028938 [Oryza meyeriana var. granulata]|uniref:Uncharacterized protein n=1 Tax=Oryza meyeriana var. granulata TaxID=110450 RepID=A0A6G1FDG0_9ORYZ|nr:hypothetical protein E2562_028938 [Oryza meyeriana var. granulata]
MASLELAAFVRLDLCHQDQTGGELPNEYGHVCALQHAKPGERRPNGSGASPSDWTWNGWTGPAHRVAELAVTVTCRETPTAASLPLVQLAAPETPPPPLMCACLYTPGAEPENDQAYD